MNLPADQLERVVAIAEARHQEAVLQEACALAGIGVRTLQSSDRTEDAARRRAVVAWILCDRAGWSQRQTARALGRTVRAVKKLLRKTRVSSPFGGTK